MEYYLKSKYKFFGRMIYYSTNLLYWIYDSNLNLVYCNAPDESELDSVFSAGSCKDYLKKSIDENKFPVVLSDPIGLVWFADIEEEQGENKYIHVIGPVFTSDISIPAITNSFPHMLPAASGKSILDKIIKLPVISITTYYPYGLMLHYCLAGSTIRVNDIHYQTASQNTMKAIDANQPDRVFHGTWIAEQTVLRYLREGNLDYNDALHKISTTGSMGNFNFSDPIRQAKNSVLVFIGLCSRAAAQGGLPPETAYTIGDYYSKSVENSTTVTEIVAINYTMYDDFIHRVHKHKLDTGKSSQIQECCDYIELHINKNIDVKALAARVGYADYYLTRKFK